MSYLINNQIIIKYNSAVALVCSAGVFLASELLVFLREMFGCHLGFFLIMASLVFSRVPTSTLPTLTLNQTWRLGGQSRPYNANSRSQIRCLHCRLQWHIQGVAIRSLIPGGIGIWNVGFLKGGKLENPEKNPRSKEENQQQTQPTCDTRSGN